MRKEGKLSRAYRAALMTGAVMAMGSGVAIGVAWAQNSILNPNVGIGTSSPVYFMDVNGGGGGGIGSPPAVNIRIPNTVGQFNGLRFSTATGDGTVAGFSGEVLTNGSYPNSSGRAHLWIQDGPQTKHIATFSKFGVLVNGGGGTGLGSSGALTLTTPNAVGQYNGIR